jgi:hypothetical protein
VPENDAVASGGVAVGRAVVVTTGRIAEDAGVNVRRTALLAGAAIVSFPLLLRAEHATTSARFPVALEYTAEPACPDVDAFKRLVVERLGYDPFEDDAPNRVSVRLMSRGRSIEGHVEWRDVAGNWAGDRSFPSHTADCQDLGRAVGFALAVQIQLLAKTSAPARPPAPPPDDSARAAQPPVPPATSRPQDEPRPPIERPPEQADGATIATQPSARAERPTLAIGAGASVAFGLSSGPVALVRVLGDVAWSSVSLELAAEVSSPATTRRADGAGFSQQQLLLSAAACAGSRRLSACLLGKGGQLRIVGEIDVPASPSGPIFQTGLRLALTQGLGSHAYLAARVEGLVNLTRWTVTLDQVPAWTAPWLAGAFGLDLGVRFH